MKVIKFRNAHADEIEIRVGATTESGFSLLLYKTARVDANILDESVGQFNWQKKFYQVKNTMICEIGINVNYDDETKEPLWVWKGDAGDESNTEAIKGEASDSFKRAGFAWNICRSLYTAPFIWINKDNDNDPKKTRYEVKTIEYTNNEITKLVIINAKTKKVAYSMGDENKVSQNAQKPQENTKPQPSPVVKNEDSDDENMPIHEQEKEWLQQYMGNLSAENYDKVLNWLFKKFGTKTIGELTASQGIIAVNSLKKAGIK